MRGLLFLAISMTAFGAQTVDFEWRGFIARGRMLEVRGVNGDIQALPSTSGEVEVVARVESETGEVVPPIKFHLMPTERGLTICAIRDNETECQPVDGPVIGPGARVNFVVKVPEGVDFRGRTVNGGVAAESLNSNVEAYTVNGGVKISTSGSAQAQTVNGSITASLSSSSLWCRRAPQFSTVNGGITLNLPAKLDASLVAETRNGKILTTNLRASLRGKITDQSLDAVVGEGGSYGALTLRTINGSILLKRRP